MNLNVKKLNADTKLPSKGHPGDAGIDFYSTEKIAFGPYMQMRVPTGIAVQIPEGCVGLIWDKSSVSFKQGLKVMGGVIDAGYRGEIIISLYNTTDKEQVIEKGYKVAQMIIQKFEDCDIVEVADLSDTVRGDQGFGSTGHK
jgi:dUTP pyrophosphatase